MVVIMGSVREHLYFFLQFFLFQLRMISLAPGTKHCKKTVEMVKLKNSFPDHKHEYTLENERDNGKTTFFEDVSELSPIKN